MQIPQPELGSVAAEYAGFERAFDVAVDPAGRAAAIARWDAARRRLSSWEYLVHLRFRQDTRDPERRRAHEYRDSIRPALADLDTRFMRKLLASGHRPELEAKLGAQALAVWAAEVACFDPVISDDLVAEARLVSSYTELTASARIEFRGETHNLAGIASYFEDPDRATRHEAYALHWNWFAQNGAELDRIYGELVQLRTAMARKLGAENFVELGYRRMPRIDYGRAEVERFRTEIRERVVPFCARLHERQRKLLGVERLMAWDEPVLDPQGNPRPGGAAGWMLERAAEMFEHVHPRLAELFGVMRRRGLLDLETRAGKAGGGFCTSFPEYGVPFIFANFNGTKGDVEVFTHEMGHAFQSWCSRDRFPLENLWPTAESCEIHSMSLEFLTWPQMEKFFGADAARFRSAHLQGALHLLPYAAAVDHFQHLVYEQPQAGAAQRHALWREMEREYLPWREYGDVAYPARGAFWQRQLHIYQLPFYYIDYALAQVCALQFWLRARERFEAAIDAYVKLCSRGGEAPFRQLTRDAGLRNPFDPGALSGIIDSAAAVLGA
jgi:M3 family oligoendopeptidase